MPLMDVRDTQLVLIDFQARLMPAIDRAEAVLANAGRLLQAARLLGVRAVTTEQSPAKLGRTVPELGDVGAVLAKTSFDACAEPAFLDAVAGDHELVVAGCEAHVCVLQTVLTLLAHRRRVVIVRDAVGSRRPESHEAALARMAAHGADIVTTEMVLFEWLRTADHPQFRAVSTLIR
ncbi:MULTISPECIES: isochorismatase family protein [unclassified Bosea (in: a-proteobacteria)]|uniref:isochorismatase family protein n=1 Tax=unclassified Bosea (in: a-proteobacteria) TaxID=2653178 RepID=UPI0009571238|nr:MULTISPECIES: isochorismatase family protein [unclassified Bosea (in: a-proteobacteria)]TAJ30609.1 MAG: isochorismatase family protein [Bosea sp. (in: a-proteobacteria)]SIQ85049.1 Nicotinamidase-related amidase [Bosea sp. TND4EK4]